MAITSGRVQHNGELSKYATQYSSDDTCTNHISPVSSARRAKYEWLVMMDSKASMEAHVLSVCKSSFIHIRNLSRIKKFVDSSSLECLVHACITTKLDYCNSLICRAPSTLINKLQRIQNIVARIITGHGRCEHITPVLKALHWLPVQQRIKFKTLVLVYKAVNNLAPVYLQELLHPHVPCRGLRSSEMNLLVAILLGHLLSSNVLSVLLDLAYGTVFH